MNELYSVIKMDLHSMEENNKKTCCISLNPVKTSVGLFQNFFIEQEEQNNRYYIVDILLLQNLHYSSLLILAQQ